MVSGVQDNKKCCGNTNQQASNPASFFKFFQTSKSAVIKELDLWPWDFYHVKVDEGGAWVNYHAEKSRVNNLVTAFICIVM